MNPTALQYGRNALDRLLAGDELFQARGQSLVWLVGGKPDAFVGEAERAALAALEDTRLVRQHSEENTFRFVLTDAGRFAARCYGAL